jgi:osmotically-inducible protein OsmY
MSMTLTTPLRAVALSAVLACLVAGCSSTRTQKSAGESIDDTVIATRIKADLIGDPVTKAGDIDVEVFKGRVQLNGFVGSGAESSRATDVARKVNGVTAVDNNLKMKGAERTVSDTVDDGSLSVQVKGALAADERTKAYQIDVNTRNAVVLLAGFVNNAAARTAAGEIATGVRGVAKVDNQIAVK